MQKEFVVISAHVGDFVWRCGGAIALHVAAGYKATIVCLSYGERGESARLYEEPGMTAEKARARRRAEAEAAADVLGATIVFLDGSDYMLRVNDEMLHKTAAVLRETQPEFILTHPAADPSNLDHVTTFNFALEARMVAQAHGHPGGAVIGAPQVYSFEPHQSELCLFKPDTLLDITSVWEVKRKAMECLAGQKALWDYYERVGLQRGAVSRRRQKGKATGPIYGEAFQSVFPARVDLL
ncbi:PIG-L deacetylase family protein [Poseidonocella sedimentorum]|uniref:4-oxalomesaconate hydratase n=1 Tax=Poseidonocella sedimentorum TaxID=871652 RepID=A0A1I6D7M5_9RHOB|nr:PIG-L deacetylase family protein [Poseidonocella sedimentorum]SFR01413.1 4-oxalomesaconate hydratase [Poseidonocella sedimentorum]